MEGLSVCIGFGTCVLQGCYCHGTILDSSSEHCANICGKSVIMIFRRHSNTSTEGSNLILFSSENIYFTSYVRNMF